MSEPRSPAVGPERVDSRHLYSHLRGTEEVLGRVDPASSGSDSVAATSIHAVAPMRDTPSWREETAVQQNPARCPVATVVRVGRDLVVDDDGITISGRHYAWSDVVEFRLGTPAYSHGHDLVMVLADGGQRALGLPMNLATPAATPMPAMDLLSRIVALAVTHRVRTPPEIEVFRQPGDGVRRIVR